MTVPHAKKAYQYTCSRNFNHKFMTDDPEARWVTKSQQARYFCPICYAAGHRPPKSWRRVIA